MKQPNCKPWFSRRNRQIMNLEQKLREMNNGINPIYYPGMGMNQPREIKLDCSARQLAEQIISNKDFEEPFIIADLSDVVDKVKLWRQYLPDVDIFYAVKVCDDPLVVKLMIALGCGADCASEGEVRLMITSGLSPSKIIFAHPCKFRSHITYAKNAGVHLSTVDREQEIIKTKELDPEARLVIRIKPERNCSIYPSLGLKFGCSVQEAQKLLSLAKALNITVEGVAFHVGYGCEDAELYRECIAASREVFDIAISMGFKPCILDIGGGYPGSRRKLDLFKRICHVVRDSLHTYFSDMPNLKVIAEPGTYIACSAMTVFLKVIGTKEHDNELMKSEKQDVISEKSVYLNEGRYGSFFLGNYDYQDCAVQVLGDTSYRIQKYQTLWGPTCDSMDHIEKCYPLPELQVGDWIAIDNMGSYTLSLPTRFNGFLPPSIKYVMSTEAKKYVEKMPEGHRFLNSAKFVN